MNTDERYGMNEEARITEEYNCECCSQIINGYEAIDPFEIEGKIFCLYCASDLTTLRFEGYLRQADKTKALVKAADDEAYLKIWQQEYDKDGHVKHI